MSKSIYEKAKEAFIDRVDAKDFVKLDTNIRLLQQLEEFFERSFKILVLYGEPGAGKTMLLHKLSTSIEDDTLHFFQHPPLNLASFSKKVAQNLALEPTEDLLETLQKAKLSKPHTIIVDEAQLLTPELLEFIRLASDTQKVRFILSFHQLKSGELITEAHFETRIAQKFHLPLPSLSELIIYIQKRLFNYEVLDLANLFSKKEVTYIYRFTNGNLRKTHRFLYTLFDILHYFEEHHPTKIDSQKIERKFLEMTAIELGYIDA